VTTSNCDGLHINAGMPKNQVWEIHGALDKLQCAAHCNTSFTPVTRPFLNKLKSDEAKRQLVVPRCPKPKCDSCLRPNVMIFGDNMLVGSYLEKQEAAFEKWKARYKLETPARSVEGSITNYSTSEWISSTVDSNWVVIEIGAGTQVPSIRFKASSYGGKSWGLIRVNPSEGECQGETTLTKVGKYIPLVSRSDAALSSLRTALEELEGAPSQHDEGTAKPPVTDDKPSAAAQDDEGSAKPPVTDDEPSAPAQDEEGSSKPQATDDEPTMDEEPGTEEKPAAETVF